MASTEPSSENELFTYRADEVDDDDDRDTEGDEDDSYEDDGLEAAPFDEEAEMQKIMAETAAAGAGGAEYVSMASSQLDSSIDILDRSSSHDEAGSSAAPGQTANEHVDSFVRSWCALLAPASAATSRRETLIPPPPRFELFAARLQAVRAAPSDSKWVYSDAEVAAAAHLASQRSGGGYVGVGELQHFMCLCKFLATATSAGGSGGDDSWAALTPAAFRQRFAASLATAAADAVGADAGTAVPVYAPPMSR
jgi:hypothetical protein